MRPSERQPGELSAAEEAQRARAGLRRAAAMPHNFVLETHTVTSHPRCQDCDPAALYGDRAQARGVLNCETARLGFDGEEADRTVIGIRYDIACEGPARLARLRGKNACGAVVARQLILVDTQTAIDAALAQAQDGSEVPVDIFRRPI